MDVIPVQTQNMAVLNWLKISPIFCVFNLLVVFPNITKLLKIFATFTFTVSTATAERSFSIYATTAEDIPANKHGVRETEWTYVYIH